MPRHKIVGGRKSVKTRKVFAKKAKPIYLSDEDIPDETADSFYKDDIDLYHDKLDRGSDCEVEEGIPEVKVTQKEAVYDFTDSEDEEEMEKRLKKIEANIRRRHRGDSSDSEEEEEDEDEVEARAWGKKRDDFYGADVSTKVDVGVSSDEDEAEAVMEEKEARKMQQKMVSEISEADFGMDMFTDAQDVTPQADAATNLGVLGPDGKSSDAPEVVQVDFSKMSQKEKERTFKQLYPEYSPIFTEFKRMLKELKNRLWPILSLRTRELLPDSPGVKVLGNKCKLMELFVQCALFYFLLVSEHEATKGHPVFGRMLQLQKLIKTFDELEGDLSDEIEFILQKVADGREEEIVNGKQLEESEKVTKLERVNAAHRVNKVKANKATKRVNTHAESPTKTSKSKKVKFEEEKSVDADKPVGSKKVKVVKKRMQDLLEEEGEQVDMTTGEREALEYYEMMRKRHRAGEADDDEQAELADAEVNDDVEATTSELSDAKRAITEEMQKTRGLTAKRPKHLKNPRIKNKLKFQRKKKIHKSMVPQVLTEVNRYSGEVGGIRAGRVRSVALS